MYACMYACVYVRPTSIVCFMIMPLQRLLTIVTIVVVILMSSKSIRLVICNNYRYNGKDSSCHFGGGIVVHLCTEDAMELGTPSAECGACG